MFYIYLITTDNKKLMMKKIKKIKKIKKLKKKEFDGTKYIKQAYISKYNERDNHLNLLMITDGTTNWHYLVIKNIQDY